jgi:hypothetical protein
MVAGPILHVSLLAHTIHGSSPDVCIIIFGLDWFRFVERSRRYLAETFAGIPHLEHNIENVSVDLPWCTPQYVQTCVYEFNISQCASLFEIDHLFLAVFVPHGLRWKNESDKPDRGNKRDHPTSVIQVPALVVTKPRLWLDEHRKMARMKSFSDTILGETFRNLRIQLNDAKLLTPHILVPMKECWLFL